MKYTRIALVTGIMFVTLKLCGVIDNWSWGYVLLPFGWFAGAMAREVEIEAALGKRVNVDV